MKQCVCPDKSLLASFIVNLMYKIHIISLRFSVCVVIDLTFTVDIVTLPDMVDMVNFTI